MTNILTLSHFLRHRPHQRCGFRIFPITGLLLLSAGKYFSGSLSEQKTVIALEFHVDYWGDPVHGGDGKWQDLFSKPAYT